MEEAPRGIYIYETIVFLLVSEVGRILPMEFGLYRSMKKFDPWKGILKNLYDRYFNQIFTRAT